MSVVHTFKHLKSYLSIKTVTTFDGYHLEKNSCKYGTVFNRLQLISFYHMSVTKVLISVISHQHAYTMYYRESYKTGDKSFYFHTYDVAIGGTTA